MARHARLITDLRKFISVLEMVGFGGAGYLSIYFYRLKKHTESAWSEAVFT